MPLDFRYHLASLAAVFGALILGVLLGVAMKEGPVLSNQVQELRKEFHRFDNLRQLDQQTDAFNQLTAKPLLRHRLYGRNVVLVSNPIAGAAKVSDDLRKTLENAGATITLVITMKPLLHELTTEQVQAIFAQMGVAAPSGRGATGELMARLAREVGTGATSATSVLRKNGVIAMTGDAEKPASIVVFLGGAAADDDYLHDADLPFLRGCARRNIAIAATEPMEAPRSVMRDYQNLVPLTIDNIDREAGRIALVLALSGDRQGHYGFKSTANHVAPELK